MTISLDAERPESPHQITSGQIHSIKLWLVAMQDVAMKYSMEDPAQATILRSTIRIWRMLKDVEGKTA